MHHYVVNVTKFCLANMCLFLICFSLTAATVSFSQSMYRVVEDQTSVELALNLSNPSSFNITVQVIVDGGNATG